MTINFKIIIILVIVLFLYNFCKKQRILGGNNKDSDKQIKFKTALEDMKTILDENNQKFFLVCGTLLGCIREKKFIEHDLDIDLGIFSDQYDKTIENKILNSDKFSLVHRLGELNKSYEISFRHINGIKIDIFLHYKIEKNIYYAASFYGLCDKKPEKYCKWKYKIDDLINYKFFDKNYLIPKNYTEYLKDRYGEDWKTPKNYTYKEGLNGLYKNLMGGNNNYDLDGYIIPFFITIGSDKSYTFPEYPFVVSYLFSKTIFKALDHFLSLFTSTNLQLKLFHPHLNKDAWAKTKHF